MKTSQTSTWTKIAYCRDGHRWYRDPAGRIACADDSIRVAGRPDTTDDGLLLLDLTRKGSFESRSGIGYSIIPLTRENGERTSTIGSLADAELCRNLGLEFSSI